MYKSMEELLSAWRSALISRVANPAVQLEGGPYILAYFEVCLATIVAILVSGLRNGKEQSIDSVRLR